MNVFDIIGPVMIGPSSSHTAGAVRIGLITRRLLGEKVKTARIGMYGSFAATGKGHGTDRALVAGLLGMEPDDIRIPASFELAKQEQMEFQIEEIRSASEHCGAERGRHLRQKAGGTGKLSGRRQDHDQPSGWNRGKLYLRNADTDRPQH